MTVSATLALQGATDISCLTSSGDALACMLAATVTAVGGEANFGMLVGGVWVLATYVSSGYHPAPPSIGTILLGALLVPSLPPQYRGIATTIMLVGFIVSVFFIGKKYFLQVGT